MLCGARKVHCRAVACLKAKRGPKKKMINHFETITGRKIKVALVGCGRIAYKHLEALDKHQDECPRCNERFRQLPKPELLYLSGLFHDIAKGRGGNHSELGAVDAYEFCRQHDVSPASFYQWRKKLGKLAPAQPFVPVSVIEGAGVSVELPCGAVVRVPTGDDRSLSQVISLLLAVGEQTG